jgi:hypothetical protein
VALAADAGAVAAVLVEVDQASSSSWQNRNTPRPNLASGRPTMAGSAGPIAARSSPAALAFSTRSGGTDSTVPFGVATPATG